MNPPDWGWQNNLIDLAKYMLPAILVIISGYLGFRYSLAHLRRQKRLEFVEKQLRDFYSPILGCREEIKAKSNLRYEISKSLDPAWREIVDSHPKPFLDHEEFFKPFKKSFDYDNKQLLSELIPLYEKMLGIFTANIWLANPTTRQWYYDLTRFVEIWHRWLADSIPVEVLEKIDLSEERLNSFYEDLENQDSPPTVVV